jgi:hypothetical protein
MCCRVVAMTRDMVKVIAAYDRYANSTRRELIQGFEELGVFHLDVLKDSPLHRRCRHAPSLRTVRCTTSTQIQCA